MQPLFDSHCHDFLDEQGTVVRDPACLSRHCVVASFSSTHWESLLSCAIPHQDCWIALGLHPAYAGQWCGETRCSLEGLVTDQRVVAIGEAGLDRTSEVPQSLQEQVLRHQIRLACAVNKPLVLHCYRSHGRLVDLLREEGAERVGGLIHGFSGGYDIAKKYLDLGFCLGIGPVLLRHNARRLPAVVPRLPAAGLLLESDRMATGCREHILQAVAQQTALLRGCSMEDLAWETWCSSRRVFRLPEWP
ncbi:MAG: TatD family hydrolase [Desulfuromonadaceae bacterium]|nr:TatD family hydrolase [Desulfuromonadaceae bacterium]